MARSPRQQTTQASSDGATPPPKPGRSRTPPQLLPTPEALEAYEQASPGIAYIVMQLVQRQHEAMIRDRLLGKIFAFVTFLAIVAAAVGCVAMGSPMVATAFVGAGALGGVSAFIGDRPGPRK